METLKDMPSANEFDRNKFSVRYGHTKLYCEEDLRQLGIRRIKYYQHRIKDVEMCDSLNQTSSGNSFRHKIDELKEIFNITDEELKD